MTDTSTTPQAALPPFVAENVGSAARFALTAAATWLTAHGFLAGDQTSQFVSIGVGIAIGGATLAWAYIKNRLGAAHKVVIAATGNPNASPDSPASKAAVAQAVLNPAMPYIVPAGGQTPPIIIPATATQPGAIIESAPEGSKP